MSKPWIYCFGVEYDVPDEVAALVASEEAFDLSDTVDDAPAFGIVADERNTRLWVDHPSPRKRKCVYWNGGDEDDGDRFAVTWDEKGETQIWVTYDVAEAIRVYRVVMSGFAPIGRGTAGDRLPEVL